MISLKKTLAAGAIALGAFLSLSYAAQAQSITAYTGADLNLRTGPGTQYPVILSMPQGAQVVVDYCEPTENWCFLNWAGVQGWASARYLTSAPPYGQYPGQPAYPQNVYPPQNQVVIQQPQVIIQPPIIIQPGAQVYPRVWPYGGFGIYLWAR